MQRYLTEMLTLPKAPDWSFYVRRGLFGRSEAVLCRRPADADRDRHGAPLGVLRAYDDRRLEARIRALLATTDPMTLLDPRAFADETPRMEDEAP